ncbi:MAG: methionyl-tRNA formyltransferase [Gammaproteobacteria bacterium]|nr:methionyl-tRNA formyltransferase [Gammaproteobacteria bacterium]
MKIAYFGFDAFADCMPVWQQLGHEIAMVFTGDFPGYTDRVSGFAQQHGIPTIVDKPAPDHLQLCVEQGINLLFAAEYPWRIPIPPEIDYTINIHPTLLPQGRGPTPLSHMLLHGGEHCGITFHKMISEMDKGDILLQEPIDIADDETYDTLLAKMSARAPGLLQQLLDNFTEIYANATPQGTGSYWPELTRADQTIDWNSNVDEINVRVRAFGHLGVFASLGEQPVIIVGATPVRCEQTMEPGTVTRVAESKFEVAVRDGVVAFEKSGLYRLRQ